MASKEGNAETANTTPNPDSSQQQHEEQKHAEQPEGTLDRVASYVGEAILPTPSTIEGANISMSRTTSGPAYSAFSHRTRIMIATMITIGSFISPVTANIYFPALNPIADDLGVSTNLINLTLTTYMVFQGLSPTLFGDFGDKAGRRPAYILAFSIYLLANIGLALQRDYAALMVLRCVQSAGSSGTIALGYAVIADIASTAERGRYMGFVGAGINVGPTLGPVLGGLLSQFLGWPSLFWFLTIFVTVWLVPWILLIPETCRNVVGNGSMPAQSWNLPLVEYLKKRPDPQESAKTQKLRLPNPLGTLHVIFEKEMGLILGLNSILYINFILTAATLSTLWKDIYHFNDLQVGLCYLPYGFGACVGVVSQGFILDWNYRRRAKKLGFKVDRKRGDDLSNFPIESARIEVMFPALTVGTAAVISYGWALHAETTVAVPLVLVFLIGLLITTYRNRG
ncbi:hypothetical protein N3K66_002095 [Trichothecium roseum]|uniref:Uncharacterized protein n=1 Tax=Trichothecium roseum TaxID=47278 RepID=A0ACC0V9D5_9HYPO|nr:hypothetical protein N3K66_002095 [Trichothecium roseum]